jgi:hypothetical protein
MTAVSKTTRTIMATTTTITSTRTKALKTTTTTTTTSKWCFFHNFIAKYTNCKQ